MKNLKNVSRKELKKIFGGNGPVEQHPSDEDGRKLHCCKEFTSECSSGCYDSCGAGQYAKYCGTL
ncbi:bacteriocin-like protein [Chryseobacterium taklimakanense]